MEIKRTSLIFILVAAVLLFAEPSLLNRFDHWRWWQWDNIAITIVAIVVIVALFSRKQRNEKRSHR